MLEMHFTVRFNPLFNTVVCTIDEIEFMICTCLIFWLIVSFLGVLN